MKLILVLAALFAVSHTETPCGELFRDLDSKLFMMFQKAKEPGQMIDGKLVVGNTLSVMYPDYKFCGICNGTLKRIDREKYRLCREDTCGYLNKEVLAPYGLTFHQNEIAGYSKYPSRFWSGQILGDADSACSSSYTDHLMVA